MHHTHVALALYKHYIPCKTILEMLHELHIYTVYQEQAQSNTVLYIVNHSLMPLAIHGISRVVLDLHTVDDCKDTIANLYVTRSGKTQHIANTKISILLDLASIIFKLQTSLLSMSIYSCTISELSYSSL